MSERGDLAEPYVPRTWPGTYVLPPQVLDVPADALALTLKVFAPYASDGLEAVCFWYGLRAGSVGGTVAAVVVPAQDNHWGRYRVRGDAMAAVAKATALQGWKNLAQIHTHPGSIVEHSFFDDDNANSRRALSLVLPNYGAGQQWPLGVAVHEFQEGQWHLLDDEPAAQRVRVTAPGSVALVDCRGLDA